MAWIKVFHLFFVISWLAGIFYLPRLFVYHAVTEDKLSLERFKLMERKLLWGIMTPSAIAAVVFGMWLWLGYGFNGNWLNLKLILVAILALYHLWCMRIVGVFARDQNQHSQRFYRWMNELPVFLLLGILILVVLKPF